MWFLESDEDLFGKDTGKLRLWLRPGTEHLFGRTNGGNDRVRVISDKTISRTHLVIKVDTVLPGDSAHLHTRSKITLTDSSKLGTVLDGARFIKSSKALDNKGEHVIKLGNFHKLLRIKWEPVTLSFTSLTKTAKQANDPVSAQRARLEALDIKCITEYLPQHTTHVVAKKRNTAAVLQALVNGRHVVTNAYVDALEAAGRSYTARLGDQEYATSALEEDFEANWPKELDYQPPPGGEPNPRPEHSEEYLPNPKRAEMFAKYTFIFCDAAQYESLGLAVVSGGGGKALLREFAPDQADLRGFLSYVKEVAGRKSTGSFKLNQQPVKGGVIIVKPNDKIQAQIPENFKKVDQSLGQRSMEQNEFLEAVLSVDASKLKRPADAADENMEDEDGAAAVEAPASRLTSIAKTQPAKPEPHSSAPALQDASQEDAASPPRPEPSQASVRRKPRRHITQSRFKGFDDFDPSQVPKYERSPSPSQAAEDEPSQAPSVDNMDVDAASQAEAPVTQRSQRSTAQKRSAQAVVENEETMGDVMDNLLKGAAAMKRRRLANGYAAASAFKSFNNEGGGEEDQNESVATVKKPRKRKEKEIDVRAVVAERRQAEEEARRQDEENLRAALEGMDVSDIRNLAQIEEMEIVRRKPPPRCLNKEDGGLDDRWDDRWNGRKNFKKFRRSGTDGNSVGLPRQRVIVSLEEVKKKQFGIGDEYWLEPVSETRRKEKERRQHQSQSQMHTQAQTQTTTATSTSQSAARKDARNSRPRAEDFTDQGEDDEDDAQRFRRRIINSRIEDAEKERTEDIDPVEIAGTARDKGIEAAAHATQIQTQTQTLGASGAQGRKRAAAAEPAAEAPATKKRQTAARRAPAPIEVEDDDDEDDPTKFRRRRR